MPEPVGDPVPTGAVQVHRLPCFALSRLTFLTRRCDPRFNSRVPETDLAVVASGRIGSARGSPSKHGWRGSRRYFDGSSAFSAIWPLLITSSGFCSTQMRSRGLPSTAIRSASRFGSRSGLRTDAEQLCPADRRRLDRGERRQSCIDEVGNLTADACHAATAVLGIDAGREFHADLQRDADGRA